ncbi:MAG: hypothetical protein ACREE4_21130 [Stellaceae bacterium]
MRPLSSCARDVCRTEARRKKHRVNKRLDALDALGVFDLAKQARLAADKNDRQAAGRHVADRGRDGIGKLWHFLSPPRMSRCPARRLFRPIR